MAKNNRQNSRVPQPSDTPLFVVCGLPLANHVIAQAIIENAFEDHCKVMHPPAGLQDGNIYTESYNSVVVNGMCEFLIRKRSKAAIMTPSKLIFLYVPTPDAERLLSKLDFAVFPIKLEALAEWDQTGNLLRHDDLAVTKSLRDAVANVKEHHEFFDRFAKRRPTDAVLLPPANFHVSKTQRLSTLFSEMRTGVRGWKDRFAELKPKEYLAGDLPRVSNTARFFEDVREVVFVQAQASAEHGGSWQIDEVNASEDNLLRTMRGLYRFGGPIPSGFQHDAQLQGKSFRRFPFDCSENGPILVTDDHADIYLNDKIRHRTKK